MDLAGFACVTYSTASGSNAMALNESLKRQRLGERVAIIAEAAIRLTHAPFS
jgi:hypothetical protein